VGLNKSPRRQRLNFKVTWGKKMNKKGVK
jgi:hypothetical protein